MLSSSPKVPKKGFLLARKWIPISISKLEIPKKSLFCCEFDASPKEEVRHRTSSFSFFPFVLRRSKYWNFGHLMLNCVWASSDGSPNCELSNWKLVFEALLYIPRSAWSIFTSVDNLTIIKLFLSIWCTRSCETSPEFVCGMFWNVWYQSVAKTLRWCGGHFQEIVKTPESFRHFKINLNYHWIEVAWYVTRRGEIRSMISAT